MPMHQILLVKEKGNVNKNLWITENFKHGVDGNASSYVCAISIFSENKT